MSVLDAGDREQVIRAIDEAADELDTARAAETAREKAGVGRNFSVAWLSHPLRRFDALERALDRRGLTIARKP